MNDRKQRPSAALAEWIVGALSALLVLAIAAYTLREGITRPQTPPLLSIRADSIVTSPDGHLVLFTLQNEGGATAATVQVQGTLTAGEEIAEESGATVDYVPAGAQRSAALHFGLDPAAYRVELRVTGFDLP